MQRTFKRGLSVCFVLMLVLACFCQPAMAGEKEPEVVRIGFPIQDGISFIDEQGKYTGYMVDYLEYVQLYTNWDIEYVQVEGDLNTQLSTLLQMLQNGEIDLMGTMNRSEALEKVFLYPNHPYGTSYTVLVTDEQNEKLMFNDFSNWGTLRVATYPGYQKRMEQLEQFAQSYGLAFEIMEFETYAETVDAVKAGIADATMQMDISMEDGLRTIASFSPTPYYFALSPDNRTLLYELNLGLDQIQRTFPSLEEQLYSRYFSVENTFYVSEEDRAFVKSLGTLRVLFIEGNPPFQYKNGGELKGCAVDYFDEFAKKTGLQYEPVVIGSLSESKELLESGQIDLIACIPVSSMLTTLADLEFTNPYLSSSMVQIYAADEQNSQQIASDEFRSNAGMALSEVQQDAAYAPWIDFYSLDYYRQNEEWIQGVAADWADTKPTSYAVAATKGVPEGLTTLLNNYANSLSETERQALIYRYSGDTHHYTLAQLVHRYRYAIGVAVVIIVLIGVVIVFWKKGRQSRRLVMERTNEVAYLSAYDTLTGAYNQNKFYELLEEDCKNRVPRTLAAFNIRDFKHINEKFSVAVANQFLNRISEMLRGDRAQGEYFCRQSADVFYLALTVDTIENIRARADRHRQAIQQIADELLDGYPISVYGSFVFTDTSPEPFDASANMGYVLAALAYAKRKDTDDTWFYGEDLHKLEQTRHYIETHMKSALQSGEFKLYLQPKKNLATGKFDQAEALVRWQPADGRMIFPNDFIPVFEENGFCKQLDLHMIELVCRQLREWMDEGLRPIGISVNQTKLLFAQADYVNILCNITEKYGIPNHFITLELLEGLSMDDHIEQLNQQILRLKKAGFQISMDDFGSGYSSLNVLGDLDIDELKVDRAFLMGNSRRANYARRHIIAEEIIHLSQKIGVNTVAEGVETPADEASILQYGYDYGQGYLYSKPIPAAEFRKKYLESK